MKNPAKARVRIPVNESRHPTESTENPK
jgi:hypothetical protein